MDLLNYQDAFSLLGECTGLKASLSLEFARCPQGWRRGLSVCVEKQAPVAVWDQSALRGPLLSSCSAKGERPITVG